MLCRVRAQNLFSGAFVDGILSTEHSASIYGQPVLLVGGEFVDGLSFQVVGLRRTCDGAEREEGIMMLHRYAETRPPV
jgi:hypothetical protein